jgi:hypothetical protein
MTTNETTVFVSHLLIDKDAYYLLFKKVYTKGYVATDGELVLLSSTAAAMAFCSCVNNSALTEKPDRIVYAWNTADDEKESDPFDPFIIYTDYAVDDQGRLWSSCDGAVQPCDLDQVIQRESLSESRVSEVRAAIDFAKSLA